MIQNIIRHEDNIYVLHRRLSAFTSEEAAMEIHKSLGTDTLLRDSNGNWFCCNNVKEVQFRDIEPIVKEPLQLESKNSLQPEDLDHTQFELGDNGGLG